MRTLPQALAITILAAAACAGHAQTAVYGQFNASRFAGSPSGDFLYGGTAGIVAQASSFGPHLHVSAEVQGRFVTHSGEGLYALMLGPRLSVPVHRLGLTPYGNFLVGFARYHDPNANGTTDDIFGAAAGVQRRLTRRIDLSAEYSWSQLGAQQNRYDPQTFSLGALFYFSR